MKKILIVTLFIIMFLGCCYVEHNYTRDNCTVIEATEQGCLIECQCAEFWFWEYEPTGTRFQIGDIVDLKMYDNCTSAYIQDDIIKSVRKVED